MSDSKFVIYLFISLNLMHCSVCRASNFAEMTQKLSCKENVLKALGKLSQNYQWRHILKTKEYEIFRSPLGKVGSWVEFRSGERPELQHIENGKMLRYTWSKRDCSEAKEDLGTVTAFSNAPFKNSFTDTQLEKLLSQNKKYFLYLWSPAMLYSSKTHNQFKHVAEQMGYTFVSLVDERPPKESIKNDTKVFGITDQYQGFHSFDLLMREAGLHYPVSFIIENGKIVRFPIVGVYSPEYLAHRIKVERRSLASEH
ncbi:MAG: hypothetical protein JNM24_05895 [Bdellovibrionaceae bacterium]|nr:hypothetical protein [Pseudobdellovibrionaceae bacterium]